jgi:ABC-type dipeptide/oligopeptide/nickel transport system ATPase subunit
MPPLLVGEDLSFSYPCCKQVRPVFSKVSFHVGHGESIGISGPSGCGKTTLSKVIMGMLAPSSGALRFGGQPLRFRDVRTGMQMVFQNPQATFNPRRTVEASLNAVARLYGISHPRTEVGRLLADLSLQDEVLNRLPSQLSGGQLQRLSILRSLLASPRLIILDEPTSALDISTQASIIHALEAIRSERDITYLFISHDIPLMRRFSDRILFMASGQLHEE